MPPLIVANRKQKIAKERGDEQIIAKKAVKQRPVHDIPRDGVGNGGKHPVKLAQKSTPIV
jgi:hypothetical protein